MKKIFALMACLALSFACLEAQFVKNPPKNIIIMIADGWGYNQILVSNYYETGKDSANVYESFPVKLAIVHSPAMTGDYSTKTGVGLLSWENGYNSGLAWTDFKYMAKGATESSASATALATGVKTYNGAIGVDINKNRLLNVTEQAKSMNKAAGVVTTVSWVDATPAGFTAHNESRKNHSEIARDMLIDSRLDVLMGCGNPNYDNDGKPTSAEAHYGKYSLDKATFEALRQGNTIEYSLASPTGRTTVRSVDQDDTPDPWTFIETKEQFLELTTTTTTPKRVCGMPRVYTTLQQYRSGATNEEKPFQVPLNPNLPNQSEMTLGALNVLKNNPNGFFLMSEGGAVDWANHENSLPTMVEEMREFNRAVAEVTKWIEKNSSWEETLLIVCGDHECGYITGPQEGNNSPLSNPVINMGAGSLPKARYNSPGHSNQPIPLFAKGRYSEIFNLLADEVDQVRGRYIQNSEIAQAVFLLWGKSSMPAK